MGLRPTQGDERPLLFSNYSPVEAPPAPLSSRPEQSRPSGPPKAMKGPFCSATTLPWKHRPPLCHLDRSSYGPSAHPRRRKAPSVQQLLSRGSTARPFVISTGAVTALRPTQGDERPLLFSNYSPVEAPPSPLSSRPEESWAFGPPKAMKNPFCSATTLP